MSRIDTGVNPRTGLSGIENAKALKLAEINVEYERVMARVTATYPQSEMLTFDKQEQEARAYLADSAASVPLLSALSISRGLDMPELVRRVISKADAFAAVSGTIVGQMQALEDRLMLAETVADVDAIAVLYTMPEA